MLYCPTRKMNAFCHLWQILLAATFISGVAAWTQMSYPNPDDVDCFPDGFETPYVCDPDSILSPEERLHVSNRLADIARSTNCDCFEGKLCANDSTGYTIAIALLKTPITRLTPPRLGEAKTINVFANAVRLRWNFGHCGDDGIVVFCQKCQELVLDHGDLTKRKIPESVRSAMELQANQMMGFTNNTLVMQYLYTNYRTLLASNTTPSVADLVLPYKDLSSGVITVMVLTSLLSVGWAVCLTYLIVQCIKRRYEMQTSKTETMSTNLEDQRHSLVTSSYQPTNPIISSTLQQMELKRNQSPDRTGGDSFPSASAAKMQIDRNDRKFAPSPSKDTLADQISLKSDEAVVDRRVSVVSIRVSKDTDSLPLETDKSAKDRERFMIEADKTAREAEECAEENDNKVVTALRTVSFTTPKKEVLENTDTEPNENDHLLKSLPQ